VIEGTRHSRTSLHFVSAYWAAALKTFLEDVQKVAALFNDFLSGVMFVILERCFDENLPALGVEEGVSPARGFDEIDITFFYVPPNAQTAA